MNITTRPEITAFGGAVVAGAVRVRLSAVSDSRSRHASASHWPDAGSDHRTGLAATVARSVVVVASLVFLLRSVAVPPESSPEQTATTPLLGFRCAVSAALLTAACWRFCAIVGSPCYRLRRHAGRPAHAVAGVALLVSSVAVPWAIRRTTAFDGSPGGDRPRVRHRSPLRRLFLIVAIALFALVAATVVTRPGRDVAAGIAVADLGGQPPSRPMGAEPDHVPRRQRHPRRPGLYLGFVAVALAGAAAWLATASRRSIDQLRSGAELSGSSR